MTTRRRLAAICSVLWIAILLLPMATAFAAPSRAAVAERIETLGAEISKLDEEYNQARLKLADVQNKIRDSEARKAEADRHLGGLQYTTSRRAAAVYRMGMPKILMVLVGSASIKEFQSKMSILGSVKTWETKLIEDLEIARDRAEATQEALNEDLDRRRAVLASISSRKKALDVKIGEQQRLLGQIDVAQRTAANVPRPVKNKPAPRPAAVDVSSLPVSEGAKIAVKTAYDQIGKPYRYGASGPDAFDCSGLTKYSWGKAGVYLPQGVKAQWNATKRVAREAMQPGDLVFYFGKWTHVGLYIGDGRMIHSVHPGERVRIDDIDYMSGFSGGGRPGV